MSWVVIIFPIVGIIPMFRLANGKISFRDGEVITELIDFGKTGALKSF